MKTKTIWALIALNLVLAIVFTVRVSKPSVAMAQAAARPSEYVMVPGEVVGGNSAVVYIVDESNGMLSAMSYNDANKTLDVMPPIELARVYSAAGLTREKIPKKKP